VTAAGDADREPARPSANVDDVEGGPAGLRDTFRDDLR
jgi:hypothetical protein